LLSYFHYLRRLRYNYAVVHIIVNCFTANDYVNSARLTQPFILPKSVNEDQLRLGKAKAKARVVHSVCG